MHSYDTTSRTLTVEEAARVLGISRTLAYEAVRRGELPAVRIGRRLLVSKAALDRLLCDPESSRSDTSEAARLGEGA